MNLPLYRRAPRGVRAAGLALTAGVFLAACGASTQTAAQSTAIRAGASQSLAGTPGSSATGSITPPSTKPASTMPGMTMSAARPSSPNLAPPVATGGHAVSIKGFAFAPAAMVVKVGTTITWTNEDGDAHTVTSQGSGGPLKSAALNTGQSYSYTFTTPGTYAYLCTIHPFMTATVTVTK